MPHPLRLKPEVIRVPNQYGGHCNLVNGRCELCGAVYNELQFSWETIAQQPPVMEIKETVDHPAHYGGADNPYEHIKVVDAWGLNYRLGNATKYIARAGKKDPAKLLEDLKKARWYLDSEIQRLETL